MSNDGNNNSENSGFLSKAIKVLALPASAISGYWVAARRVYVNAYDNAKDHGVFNDLVDASRRKGMQDIGAEAIEAVKANNQYKILEKSIPFHTAHNEKVLQRFKDIGLGSTRERWKFLRADQKHGALIEFMTVAGIAVGALLTVATNRTISHLLQNDQDMGVS